MKIKHDYLPTTTCRCRGQVAAAARRWWVLLLIFSWLFLSGFMSLQLSDANALLKEVKQDFLAYVPASELDKPLIAKDTEQKFYQNYLQHYFSPWDHPDLLDNEKKVKQIEEDMINKFTAMLGWGENQQLHTISWLDEIVQNMNLKTYPNNHQTGITICVTHLRELPTVDPSFKSWDSPGDNYPFDRLTASLLPANLPVKIVQISKDGAWALTLTPYQAIGWLPFNDVAFVDEAFIKAWETGHYAAVIKDKVSMLDSDRNFLFFARIGSIHPIVADRRVLIAKMGQRHQAVTQVVDLAKENSVDLPMSLTGRNLAKVANVILGQPYDWGGYYGYRDCSATLMDLFTPFAIWLPRSSTDQAHAGKFISLENLDIEAKQKLIHQRAVPFLTLLWLPGHITLYVGEQEGRGFVYQTAWSMPVERLLTGKIRLPIGRTVITPFNFGEDFPIHVTNFLKRVEGMTLINEVPAGV